jgi:hypothetical protein
MCSRRAPSIERLFCEAIEIATPEKRQAFLDEACRGNPEIRKRVLRLVDAHFKASHFLDIRDPIEHRDWPRAFDQPGLSYVRELFSEILLQRPELDEAKRQLEDAFHVLNDSSMARNERWLELLRELIAICEQADHPPTAASHDSSRCREGCL